MKSLKDIENMSLEELEEYALNELGMQQCRPWQIVYIETDMPSEG